MKFKCFTLKRNMQAHLEVDKLQVLSPILSDCSFLEDFKSIKYLLLASSSFFLTKRNE